MSKKTITITDLADVRDGDICTVKIGGRQYTGPAYTRGDDILVWGDLDACAHMVESDISSRSWETEGDMPDPREVAQ